jgi:hypothetical protein
VAIGCCPPTKAVALGASRKNGCGTRKGTFRRLQIMVRKTLSFLATEFKEMLPPTLYFLVTLNLLVLTVSLLSDGHVVSAICHASACIAALLVGKAFLLADKLPWMERQSKKPLISAAIWSAACYYLIATALHVAERLISAALDSRGFLFRLSEDVVAFDFTLFIVVQLWLALLLIVYSIASIAVARYG